MAVSLVENLSFAFLRDIAPAAARGFSTSRAHIYRRKMQRGRRGAASRGQSAPAKERTDISRRKRRFRVVVPLFAVGIIIGLPGNPGGRRGGWCGSGFVVGFSPTTVQKEERRAGSSVAKGRERGRGEGQGVESWFLATDSRKSL